MKPKDWAIVSVLFFMAVLCARLGIWQLARRQERLSYNVWLETQLSKAGVVLEPETISLPDWEYRRVEVSGHYQNAYSIVLRNRSYLEQPGIHVVTPLIPVGGSEGVLVDRGWISNETYLASGIEPFAVDETVTIAGIIRESHPQPSIALFADPTHEPGTPPKVEWKIMNVESIQSQIPINLQMYYIALTEEANGRAELPIPNPEIDLSQGPHLSYAIQWFGFAAIASIGGIVWWRRQSGKDKLNHEPANL